MMKIRGCLAARDSAEKHRGCEGKFGQEAGQQKGLAQANSYANHAGPPYTTRTCDLRLRRPLLYPTELRAGDAAAVRATAAQRSLILPQSRTNLDRRSNWLRMRHEPAEEENPASMQYTPNDASLPWPSK